MAKPTVSATSRKTIYELGRCPICDGKEASEVADRASILEEFERVWSFHSRRFRHPVPPKYLTDRVVFSQPPAFSLLSCTGCSHVYRNPRESAETVRRAYAEPLPSETVYEALFENQRRAYRGQIRRLRKFAGRINNGLEVGSYMGGFLAAARDAGMSFVGIDVNASAKDFGSRQGLRITTGELEDIPVTESYDAIAIWSTFEQLPDVRAAARAARGLLKAGGVLALRVPNVEFYTRWRRRLDGVIAPWAERMLAHNNLLGFPYREGFTQRSLERLLADARLRIEQVHGDTLVPVADRWTRAAGAIDEHATKLIQRTIQHGWRAPWIEIYARGR